MSTNDVERARQVDRLFDEALDLEPGNRASFVAAIGDGELRREVTELLAASEEDGERLAPGRIQRGRLLSGLTRSLEAEPTIGFGTRLGPFRVSEILGRGGWSEVYLAKDETGGEAVALKVLRPGRLSESARKRFRREAAIAARLTHPAIARRLGQGDTPDGRPWIALELVDGLRLDEHCDRHRLTLAERVRLVADVADAVAYAHEQGLVHRDLKPSNILVDGHGAPHLLDFGIARALEDSEWGSAKTVTSMRMMTLDFASPEQLAGRPVEPPSDQYQLALVLFELVTGHRFNLLDGPDPDDVARRVLDRPVGPTSDLLAADPDLGAKAMARSTSPRRLLEAVAGDLDRIFSRALAKEPADRYPSMEAFRSDLRAFAAGRALARSGGPPRWLRPGLAAMVGVVLVAVAILWPSGGGGVDPAMVAARHAEGHELEEAARLLRLEPPRDLRPDLGSLEDRVARLLDRSSEADGGASRCAAGRALLGAGALEGAEEQLRRAWTAGDRDGALRYALGRVLAARADRERRTTVGEGTGERLRDEAVLHLEAAIGQVEAPESYILALVAHTKGEWRRAAELAARARGEAPWLYQADLLEGESRRELGLEQLDSGNGPGARRELDRSREALERAARIGRSDEEVAMAACAMWADRLLLDEVDVDPAEASSACRVATVLRPDLPAAHRGLATLWRRLGVRRAMEGGDPKVEVAAARVALAGLVDAESLVEVGLLDELEGAPDDAALHRLLVAPHSPRRFDGQKKSRGPSVPG